MIGAKAPLDSFRCRASCSGDMACHRHGRWFSGVGNVGVVKKKRRSGAALIWAMVFRQ